MSMKITFAEFQRLLDEDLDWLSALPRTLERDHVIQCIEWMQKDREGYERIPAPSPSA